MTPAFLLLSMAMGIVAHMAGGGFGGAWLAAKTVKVGRWEFNLKWLPAAVFAVPFGVTAGHAFGAGWGLLGWGCSYLWMQTGYGIVLPWGGVLDPSQRGRVQFLSPVVDWLADRLGVVKTQPDGYSRTLAYCRLFMAVKGFLIGLPVGGALLAVLWPLTYEIKGWLFRAGVPLKTAHATTETLTGVFSAAVIMLMWAFTSWT